MVTIKGYHLDRASTVKFNGTVATFTPGTANQITAVVPVGATTGPIVVAGATEADTSTSDFHVGVYHLDSISPASARVGYPVVIYSSDGIDGLIPKIDGIPFDSIIYDPTIRAYRAIVPHGVGAGVVSMGSVVFVHYSQSFTNCFRQLLRASIAELQQFWFWKFYYQC